MYKLLIVVDMQKDFVDGALGFEGADRIIPGIIEKIKEFEAEGGQIVYTLDTHFENYMETQEGNKLPVPHCIKGSDGWEIVPELKSYANKVFEKPTFGSKELADFVTNNEYESITLIGVCTGICVLSNAILIKAFAPEVPVRVIAGLCACVTPETHETALRAMETCQIEVVRS